MHYSQQQEHPPEATDRDLTMKDRGYPTHQPVNTLGRYSHD